MNAPKFLAIALAIALLQQSIQAAIVTNNLSGNVEYDGWDSLTSTTPGLNVTVLSTTGFGSNEAGSGDAVLTRTSGSHYPASASLYSFGGNSTFEVSDSSALSDVNTVVFSIVSWRNGGVAINAGPSLNYNGGSQALAPDYLGEAEYGTIEFGGTITTYAYTFQWDLSSVGDTITSYDVDWGQIVHAGVLAIQLESADVFSRSAAVVPEPSCGLLVVLGLAAFADARRQARRS